MVGSVDGQVGKPGLREILGVVALGLTAAALLATAGAVTAAWNVVGGSVGDHIVDATVFSPLTAGTAFAAAIALRAAGPGGAGARVWARAATAIVAVVAVAASVYSAAAFVIGHRLGVKFLVEGSTERVRLGYAAGALAVGFIGAATLVVLRHDRSRASDGDLPEWRLGVPSATCLLLASFAVVVQVASSSLAIHGVAFTDRLANASFGFVGSPMAIAVLAAAVFVAATRSEGGASSTNDGLILLASILGLVTVIAAGYAVGYAAVSHPSGSGLSGFIVRGWSARASSICGALGSGVIGAAAVFVTWRLPLDSTGDPAVDGERNAPRRAALLAGVLLALAATGSAVLDLTFVAAASPIAISDRLVQVGTLVLLTAGLLLASAIVMKAFPAVADEPAGRAATSAVAAVAAVAVAVIAVSGYAFVYVLVKHGNARLSLVTHLGAAQRIGYASMSAACAIVAVAALQVLSRDRAPLT